MFRDVGRVATAVCLAATIGAACARAQSRFGVALGRSIPTGSFRQDANGQGFEDAWLLAAGVTLTHPQRRPDVRIDATYAKSGANDRLRADLTTAFGQPADESITLLGANAGLVYPLAPGSRFGPSLMGGIGLWYVSVAVTAGGDVSRTAAAKLAWQIGAQISRGPVVLEARYVSVAAVKGFPGTAFVPVTVGFRFGRAKP